MSTVVPIAIQMVKNYWSDKYVTGTRATTPWAQTRPTSATSASTTTRSSTRPGSTRWSGNPRWTSWAVLCAPSAARPPPLSARAASWPRTRPTSPRCRSAARRVCPRKIRPPRLGKQLVFGFWFLWYLLPRPRDVQLLLKT